MCLLNLAAALQTRFKRVGSIEDLDRAIQMNEQAIQFTALDYPHRAMYLNNLGNALQEKFEKIGSMADLDHAIEVKEEAVKSNQLIIVIIRCISTVWVSHWKSDSRKQDRWLTWIV